MCVNSGKAVALVKRGVSVRWKPQIARVNSADEEAPKTPRW